MTSVLNRLSEVGFRPNYVRSVVLPEWWDDEIANTRAGYVEGLGILSRHLGLELQPLIKSGRITFQSRTSVHFKKSSKVSESDLLLAERVATQALWLTGFKTKKPYTAIPESAAQIRREIISMSGGEPVNLKNLLAYCWNKGIVVLHICNFPPTAKKMEGLATLIEGRPGIVLCKNHQSAAWMVFLLAHELGHIAKGHIKEGGVLVDEKVSTKSTDKEEQEANGFAIELLTGDSNTRFTANSTLNAKQLAASAKSVGNRFKIDPGVVALNYAWEGKLFALANAALNIIESSTSAVKLMDERMREGLDWSEIPESNRDYISKVTETNVPS